MTSDCDFGKNRKSRKAGINCIVCKDILYNTTIYVLKAKGLLDKNERQEVAELIIYPHDFFCPIRTTDGKMFATDRTVTIHHYAASWTSSTHRFLRKIVLFVGGAKLKFFLVNLLKKTGSKNEKK